ncbi:MAG: transporter substrate-binding domain-containing protein [Alsobacter sp.]
MPRSSDRVGPLRVGALFSETGATAYVEQTQRNAVCLAVEEINAAGGVEGREVELLHEDARSDPARFGALAEHMLDDLAASLLIGCYMSHSRQAVLPVVARRGALLAYPAPYEGFEYSPHLIYGGAVPNQHILMLARHLTPEPGCRFYLVGTRYTFPIESNRVMMALVAEQKGSVVAERYVKLEAPHHELRAIVQDIKARKPDVVFCTVVGEAAGVFLGLCRDADIAAHTQIASLTITEAEIAQMGPGAAVGHLTAATWFETVANAESRRFVHAYRQRFGSDQHANAMAETAYGLTHMVLRAVGRGRSVAPDVVRRELAASPYAAPQGSVRFDPDNGHFYLWPRIGRAESDGSFSLVEESPRAVKPDPYLVNHRIAEDVDDVAAEALPGE